MVRLVEIVLIRCSVALEDILRIGCMNVLDDVIRDGPVGTDLLCKASSSFLHYSRALCLSGLSLCHFFHECLGLSPVCSGSLLSRSL